MTATHRNRLKTTISAVASAGLGAFTVDAASSGYRTFVAGDDGLTFDGVLIVEGTAWEVRDGCVYTHSGTSLSRGTLQDSSTGSAIAFTSAAVVSQSPSAGLAGRIEQVALVRATGGDSSITLAPNTHYTWDLSTLTADRTGTLPTTAAVGDVIEISATTSNASYELLLSTGSGQTCALGGTVVAASTEITRLFIAGESMRFVYEASNKWVAQDGRIPCNCSLEETSATTCNHATYTKITVDSSLFDIGGIGDPTTNNRITARRAGKYIISGLANMANIAADTRVIGNVYKNGSAFSELGRNWNRGTGVTLTSNGAPILALAAGDYVELWVQWNVSGGSGSKSTDASAGMRPYLSVCEVL